MIYCDFCLDFDAYLLQGEGAVYGVLMDPSMRLVEYNATNQVDVT